MSQHDFSIANQGFPAFRSDLNDALVALASSSSGNVEPTTTYANQLWMDTTAHILKVRNEDNNAWISLATFDQATDTFSLTAVDLSYTGTLTGGTGVVNIGSGQVYKDASGNVGIGTSSPLTKLDIKFATDKHALFNASSSYSNGADLVATNDAGSEIALGLGGNTVRFYTNTTERLRIDSNGNLLVGTTSTLGAKFALYGTGGGSNSNIQITNPGYGTACIGLNGTSSNLKIYNSYSSGTIGTGKGIDIDTNGYFFLNYMPTTASGANCTISTGEGNKFYVSTSALKYKQDIRDLENIDINLFRPVRYKSKCEGDDQTKDFFGFIADEIHEAGITELISYDGEGEVNGFQYDRLTVVLMKALQEQQTIIESLTARVIALEGN